MAGAQVVFVDIDPTTYLIDVGLIEAKITPRTKAIIPVHLYGQPADMQAVRAIAKQHNLFVIGDAAQAHGAADKGVPIAQLADITAFSFYPGKNLGAYGDGGAFVTDNDEWAAKGRMFANHGRSKKYDHDFEGVNSRLDGLQAAILSVKLRHIEHWTESRRRIARRYNDGLKGTGLIVPAERPDVKAVYHLYVVRYPRPRERDCSSTFRIEVSAVAFTTRLHCPISMPIKRSGTSKPISQSLLKPRTRFYRCRFFPN